MIGGFYNLPRFLILTLLSAALLLAWLDIRCIAPVVRTTRSLWLLSVGLVGIGLLQIVPLPASMASLLSGTFSLRRQYAGLEESASSMLSLVPWETYGWLAMAMIGIVGMFLGAGLFQGRKSKIFLLGAVAACGAAQVFWGLVQIVVHPDKIIWGVANEGGTTPFGTFLVRNHGADFIGMSLLCAIGLLHYILKSNSNAESPGYGVTNTWQQAIIRPSVLASGLLVVWLTVGLICSNSRGGWSSFLITIVAIVLVWRHTGQPRRIGRFVGFLAIALLTMVVIQSVGLLDRFETRVGDLNVDRVMADGRWQLWKDSIPAIIHFLPLGSGLGTYGYAILPFEPEPTRGWLPNAHNQFIEMLVEAGLPGILLVLIFLVFAGRATVSLCQSDRTKEKQALGIAGFGTLLFQSLHAVTEFGLLMPANLLTASILIGAAAAAAPSAKVGVQALAAKASDSTPSPQSNRLKANHQPSLLPANLIVLFLGIGLAVAVYHQARSVRSDRLLASTIFAPSTPSPTVATADQWLAEIDQELTRSPLNEVLRRRLIQLHMHRAQRVTYDQIRAGQVAQVRPSNPVADWDRTSLESIIMQLYDTSDRAPTELQKQRIRQQIATEPNLATAWDQFQLSLTANPIQPKTHLRVAQLGAASGRPWQDHFEHSMRLSVVDSRQSLGNGLLAWAAGDTEAMTQQWRQTLSVDLTHLELIYRLSRLKLTDEAIATHLMPENWMAPYRLSAFIAKDRATEGLRKQLLQLASENASKEQLEYIPKQKTMAVIASALQDYQAASEHYKKAVQADLKDPELRYLLAYSLYRSGNPNEAAIQARVAMNLAPTNERYKKLFEQSKRQHRRQAITP
jgi:O-antigen ligase/tetratricopeptide (TPR) repeat protein